MGFYYSRGLWESEATAAVCRGGSQGCGAGGVASDAGRFLSRSAGSVAEAINSSPAAERPGPSPERRARGSQPGVGGAGGRLGRPRESPPTRPRIPLLDLGVPKSRVVVKALWLG